MSATPTHHLEYSFKGKRIMDDAATLIVHHVKRQSSLHKDDKRRIKHLLWHALPDLFFHERGVLSDDENDMGQ